MSAASKAAVRATAAIAGARGKSARPLTFEQRMVRYGARTLSDLTPAQRRNCIKKQRKNHRRLEVAA